MKKPIPRTDSGTPPREEHVSSHDFHLPNLLDATDDEDSGEDTAMLLAAKPKSDAESQAVGAIYLSRKHARLTKRMRRLENIVIALIGAEIAAGICWELIKAFVLHH